MRCGLNLSFAKFFLIGFTFIIGLWHPFPKSSICVEFNMKVNGGHQHSKKTSRLSFGKAALSHVFLTQGNNLFVLANVSVGG